LLGIGLVSVLYGPSTGRANSIDWLWPTTLLSAALVGTYLV
jgi:hypothetical protein